MTRNGWGVPTYENETSSGVLKNTKEIFVAGERDITDIANYRAWLTKKKKEYTNKKQKKMSEFTFVFTFLS